MSIVFLDRSAVHYESIGRGRPVLFLHGWFGSWRYWVPAMQHISGSYGSYALDLWGYGDTAIPPSAATLEVQCALVEGFLEEMGIARIALVGHGLGALAGLSLAARQPSRIRRVMAIAMPLDPTSIRPLPYEHRQGLEWLIGPVEYATDLFPDPYSAVSGDLKVAVDAPRVHADLAALGQAQIPCVLVYGAQDPLVLHPAPEHTVAFGSNVHQVVLPASRHFPMIDSADAFHRLLIDFLTMGSDDDPRSLRPRAEWRRQYR